jgi:broad specificity phosphatase PhoE
MRLFLIRHGQTAWNATGRAQGHSDIELDSQGLAQADALGRAYRGRVAKVLSSDLKRASETAKALECPNTWLDKRLRERGFGQWEGMEFAEFHRMLPREPKAEFEFRPPGGESFHDVWTRTEPLIASLNDEDDDLAIVTHGGTCSLLLAQLLRGTLQTSRSFRFGNTAVTELERRRDGLYTMIRYNCTAHLSTPARQGDLDGSRVEAQT